MKTKKNRQKLIKIDSITKRKLDQNIKGLFNKWGFKISYREYILYLLKGAKRQDEK